MMGYSGRQIADVFLSYSHDDREIVEKIASNIQARGFECWKDKDRLRAMDPFNVLIEEAIDESQVFIAFLSKTYVSKDYCIHEFNRAIDKKKSKIVVCIDDVNEYTNRKCSYMFSFSSGHNLLGFGSGFSTDEEFSAAVGDICDSVPMVQLKRYQTSGEPSDLPPANTPDYIFSQLRLYHERQYVQSGNYAFNEIRGDLFPSIKDTEINVIYKDEDQNEVSLIRYITDSQDDRSKKHIMLTGEGGMGKTISLLKTTEYLLQNGINAIYVPLSKIDRETPLDLYLERNVCGGNQNIWEYLKYTMSSAASDKDTTIVLLLDGINEIPLDYVEDFIKKSIKDVYIDSYKGVQLIMTSRWFDSQNMNRFQNNVITLEMQPLDESAINKYLENSGLPAASPELLSVLSTPLLLTLYADVEKHREKYQQISGIELEDNPDTAGKILGNFFQTQLYRAAEEANFDREAHLVLLEYWLPSVAFKMVENNSMKISEDDVWNCVDELEDSVRFEWYRKDRLRRLIQGRGSFDADSLINLAVNSLHFLHMTDNSYEFLHQNFRDYFAAYHIATEIKALNKDTTRLDKIELYIANRILPHEIISYISDITHEEEARPILNEDGWVYPGKDGIAPSKNSLVEKILSLWRNIEGGHAQTAVYNILNIMRVGRKDNLSWCDFSGLDLRACKMNRCHFVEWYKNDLFPSSFDGAWIDKEFFLNSGHEANITAVETDGDELVFSGDQNGVLKIYDCNAHTWKKTVQLHNSPIVDLAWNEKEKVLAVLYKKVLFIYSLEKLQVIHTYGNPNRNKEYRYVKFLDDSMPITSYDLEPLIWYKINGEVMLPNERFEYDVPARCAVWHPYKKMFIRSYLLQMLSVDYWNEETETWYQHPALIQKRDDINRYRMLNKEKAIDKAYLTLRDYGVISSSGVNCLCFSATGETFLVAIQNILLEFDTNSLSLVNKRVFNEKLGSACYGKDKIVVGAANMVYLLETDFSTIEVLSGSQIKVISMFTYDPDGDGYYVLSKNGELKKLDNQLNVQRIRRVCHVNKFAWVKDRLTQEKQVFFLPSREYEYGISYSYDKDLFMNLGWRYEFIDMTLNRSRESNKLYLLESSLMNVGSSDTCGKIIYTNYGGIWIFGCSYKGIKGEMAEYKHKRFIEQNGGLVYE